MANSIQSLLTPYSHKSLLWVAPVLSDTIIDDCAALALRLTHQLPTAVLPPVRFDLAVVTHTLEELDKCQGRTLLGLLRNCHSDEVLVLTQSDDWQLADFIALGFRQETADGLAPDRLYRYVLASYNQQRSWNNARFWANPQNFNRFRW